MGKKVTFEIALERFTTQGRTDIQLCEDGFEGWKTKSKFYDLVEKDYFWSIPADVYRLNIVHPNRRMTKRKKTNIKRFGVDSPQKSKAVREKTKQTCLEKYGTEHYLQSTDKQSKTKKTNLEKYGAEHHMKTKAGKDAQRKTIKEKYGVDNVQQNKTIREKTNKTILKKYGVKNLSQSKELKEKKKKTSLKNWGVEQPLSSEEVRRKSKETIKEKFGVEHQMHCDVIKNKIKQTNLDKYGVEHWSKTQDFKVHMKKKFLKETGQWVKDWLEDVEKPKPSYISVVQNFTGQVEIDLVLLEKYVENYRSYKTNLERYTEQLFETKHYNKSPKQISSMCRPDFKLNDTTYLNVDGLYWHCELQKDKWSHFNLREEFEETGFRLFQFYENEIYQKADIVKSIINNSLGKTQDKFYARKCKVKTAKHKEATEFLNQNHLMGSTNAKHLGLYYGDELTSILSWKCKGGVCKIERFCSKVNSSVVGGFSKLLSHLEKNCLKKDNITEVHNWVDLRYGTGDHLINKGFKLKKETLGWKWTDNKNTFNRLRCRANMDHRKLSMREHADELGWFKIYDAGQRLWVKYL